MKADLTKEETLKIHENIEKMNFLFEEIYDLAPEYLESILIKSQFKREQSGGKLFYSSPWHKTKKNDKNISTIQQS